MTELLEGPVRAILFDLDDTLYDRGAAFGLWAEDYLHHRCGLTDDAERRAALARLVALDAGGYGPKAAVQEELGRLLLPAGGQECLALAAAFYDEFFAHLTLDPAAAELLDYLEVRGVPWGVVTNGQARQWRKLEQMGLTRRTSCLFVSATFGCKKPDPVIFLAAAGCLGTPPGEVLFVGDHPANDVLGAGAVGMRTAWLPRRRPWPAELAGGADVTLHSLTDLRMLWPGGME